MDDSRRDDPILEQGGRRRLLITVAGGLVGVAALAAFLVAGARSAEEPGPRPWHEGDRVIVEVLNGSGRTGLARQVTRRLRLRGVDVIYFGNADALADTTVLLVRRGEVARGHEAARALEQGIVRSAADSLRRVDVSIILGRDYEAPTGGPPF
jgi:hypothetical protein